MITDYSHSHMDVCVELFFNVFTAEPWNHHWLSRERIERYFTDMANTPGFAGFLYSRGRRLCGACFGMVEDYFQASQYSIKEIFIDPRLQRAGLGSKFIREIEAVLAARGVNNIALMTMKSIPAYGFYKKNGFVEVDDAVLFTKEL
jgi:ribosomal protein S18 acetylase RimI-like enzyme